MKNNIFIAIIGVVLISISSYYTGRYDSSREVRKIVRDTVQMNPCKTSYKDRHEYQVEVFHDPISKIDSAYLYDSSRFVGGIAIDTNGIDRLIMLDNQ